MIYFNSKTDKGLQAQLDKAAEKPATVEDHRKLVKAAEKAVEDAKKGK